MYSQGALRDVGGGGEGGSDDDEDGPVVVGFTEEVDLMHDEMRSQLPMSFGEEGDSQVDLIKEWPVQRPFLSFTIFGTSCTNMPC